MNLATRYIGLDLSSPFMAGASTFSDDLDGVRRLEDGGASALVMHSLFEEQISREEMGTLHDVEGPAESFAEALSYFPDPPDFKLGPEAYLERIRKVKEAIAIPVVASLNGSTPSGWVEYARLIQQAGADALELNVYFLPTRAEDTCDQVEHIVRGVKNTISIPLAVKLSPFYSSLPHVVANVADAGASGVVLFNRFLQPDINIEELEVEPSNSLSDSSELLLRLRWLAILSGQTTLDLACSGGIHTIGDAVKAIMAGATGLQVVSALFKQGPGRMGELRKELEAFLESHEYESLEQMRGSMNHSHCPNPEALERANYIRVLQGWRADVQRPLL
ncbi:MAG: dihydroorotate dehydrogenase-like protein [Myxococcota bacterium]